jgi:hypothetical protein
MDVSCALQIRTAIKALTDVVLPAVDPDNKLAQEQVRLVIGALAIVAQRMPLVYRYQRAELDRFIVLAETLQTQTQDIPESAEALRALTTAVVSAKDVLDRARADPTELEEAIRDLRDYVGALITAAYSQGAGARSKAISTTVTAHAKQQLLRERAWLIGQGWEADPGSIPPIETLIRLDEEAART